MAVLIDQVVSVPVGTRQIEANAPNGLTTVMMRLYRRTANTPTYWDAGINVRLRIYLSTDGGQNWVAWAGFTAPGGVIVGRDGVDAPYSFLKFRLPDLPNRRLRAEATVTGARLVSRIVVEVE
jgi:hypothetical protein